MVAEVAGLRRARCEGRWESIQIPRLTAVVPEVAALALRLADQIRGLSGPLSGLNSEVTSGLTTP